MNPVFEFDEAKSASNKEKHGIDFVEAQLLWDDGKMLVVPTRSISEERWVAIGVVGKKSWTAVFTWREDAVRIISVRRARDYEIKAYFRRGV